MTTKKRDHPGMNPPFRGRCLFTEHSSFRKLQRAYNRGTEAVFEPDNEAITRHKVRRIEIERAANRLELENSS